MYALAVGICFKVTKAIPLFFAHLPNADAVQYAHGTSSIVAALIASTFSPPFSSVALKSALILKQASPKEIAFSQAASLFSNSLS